MKTTATLNIRSTASTSGSIVGSLSQGSTVTATAVKMVLVLMGITNGTMFLAKAGSVVPILRRPRQMLLQVIVLPIIVLRLNIIPLNLGTVCGLLRKSMVVVLTKSLHGIACPIISFMLVKN